MTKLEGFVIKNGKYVCSWKSPQGQVCSREYVRQGPAQRHAFFHAEMVEVGPKPGDALREIATEMRLGKLDLNGMADKLDLAAFAVDSLHDEIKDADLRELQRKANAWDSVVAALEDNGVTVAK